MTAAIYVKTTNILKNMNHNRESVRLPRVKAYLGFQPCLHKGGRRNDGLSTPGPMGPESHYSETVSGSSLG